MLTSQRNKVKKNAASINGNAIPIIRMVNKCEKPTKCVFLRISFFSSIIQSCSRDAAENPSNRNSCIRVCLQYEKEKMSGDRIWSGEKVYRAYENKMRNANFPVQDSPEIYGQSSIFSNAPPRLRIYAGQSGWPATK